MLPLSVCALLTGGLLPSAPPPREYIFIPDCDRRVGFLRDGAVHVGRIDADGGFHESETLDARKPGSVKLKQVGSEWIDERLAGPYENLSCYGPTFEFKKGSLVRGVVNIYGVFVPDQPGEVLDFRDYRPGPGIPPIWNLPGYFMRRDKLEQRRKWLSEHLWENPDYAKEKAKLDAAIKGER